MLDNLLRFINWNQMTNCSIAMIPTIQWFNNDSVHMFLEVLRGSPRFAEARNCDYSYSNMKVISCAPEHVEAFKHDISVCLAHT
jgi:hypothetical protein